jgi:sigma-B regulation protein RsbU (phosphoserine phosphatase)
MRLRKILLLVGVLIFSTVAFVINTISKNVDLGDMLVLYGRSAFVISSFLFLYFYLQIFKREHPRSIVQSIGGVAFFSGIFLAFFLIVSLLPHKGFEIRQLKLLPLDYLTILFSSILSIAAGIFGILTILFIKDLVLYKRKKNSTRNYRALIGLITAASLSTLTLRPLEEGIWTGILSGLSIVMIIVNSFRLAWIAYLPRKEKIYALLYSLLSFFGFLAILVILSIQDAQTQKGIQYYSTPLFTFLKLSTTFGAVYFGMSFISTLFHLPTAEAFDRKQTEISSLHNLNRLINQVFDLKDLADTATKMMTEVVQAASAWLEILPNESSAHQSGLISARNISEEELQRFISSDDISARTIVLQTKKVLMIDDVASDRRTTHLPALKIAGSLLILPLLSHNNLIGILYATKEISYGFDQDDVDILTGFADQVAIAIENARLIEKSLEKERLQRELMLAQEMQKRLLPQQLPVFPTVDLRAVSSPALEVGGDYYDVVQIDADRVGIVIGDVSGKGVGAAFYMAEVKGIFQSLAKIYSSPKDFLMKANEALISSIDKRSFISLIYSTLNTLSGELIIARAGHCPILYVSAHQHEYLKPVGIGLGMKAGAIFDNTIEEKRIMMHNGDICVLYTDGVTESRSSSGEEFGYERLKDVVLANKEKSADEIKEAVIQQVWNYTDAKGYHDDLTIFVIKWIGV